MDNLAFANLSPVEKGALLVSDLAPGGKLPAELVERFVVLAIKGQKLLTMIRVETLKNPEKRLPKAQMTSRVLRAGTSMQALPLGSHAKPTFTETLLQPKLFRGAVSIPDEVYEDNAEREGLKNTVNSMVAERVGQDLEEVFISGDTASADPFLMQFDGIIKQATSHVVPAGGVDLDRAILKAMFLEMPIEFRKDKSRLAYLTSTNAEMIYRDSLADRATPEGDKRLMTDGGPVFFSGIPLHDIPMFPYELGGSSNETVTILSDLKNMVLGLRRDITIERKREPATTSDEWHITLRADGKYVEETAVVKATGITN